MTRPLGRQDPAERAPEVTLDPELRASAGSHVALRVAVTNRAPEPRIMAINALGVDSAWLPRPSRTRPVMPGETVYGELTLSPAPGTMPARYPLAIAVQALDPVSDRSTSPTTLAETVLVVDAPGQISVEVQPADVTGFRRRKVTVLLRNSSPVDDTVHLEVQSPETAEVRLARDEVHVPGGGTASVRGRVRIEPRLFGHRSRYTYTVSARGSGAPRRAEASVTTRAFLGANASKAFVLIAVVTLWAGLALVFIPKLADKVRSGQNKAAGAVSTAQDNAQNKATGALPGGKSASPSASAGGNGGSGGSNGGGSGGASGGGAGAAAGSATASAIQLNGTVAGRAPGGVGVAIQPTSLVDEAAQGATPVGVDTASTHEIGKVPGSAVLLTAPSTTSQSRNTVTSSDGAWSFSGVKAPGYYLLVFTKPGYQTQRYIVDSSTAVAAQPLAVTLAPGQGSLSGQILTSSGQPVGAAQITITDGTNTITTSSNSKGAVGTWSVNGLSTPSSYLVSASKDGMGTESSIVTLDAGGHGSVNLKLSVGVASLVGKIQGADALGVVAGLGGVQVTATDGTVNRVSSTVTTGSVVGNYTLPGLAPGRYTVTASLPGYLPQTQEVVIKRGQSKVNLDAVLKSATASVAGIVTGPGGTPPVTGPVNGAGLTLTSAANSYKITSGADGSFRINGVAPGTYVLSAEYFGLTTSFVTVTANAGEVSEVPSSALALKTETSTNISSITGFVASAVSPSGTLSCPPGTTPGTTCVVTFTLTDSGGQAVNIGTSKNGPFVPSLMSGPATNGPTGYELFGENGLPPGLYRLTIGATNFLPATINVRVPANATAQAPQANLFPGNTISGRIDALGDLFKDGPTPLPSADGYPTCVWAVPVNSSTPSPTTCTFTAPTPSQCQTKGLPEKAFAVLDAPHNDTTYSLDGLCDGTYNVFVITENPWYINPAPTASQTVTHGQTVTYSPHVARKGHVVLTISKFNSDGSPGTLGSLHGTVKCGGSSIGDLSTINPSTKTVIVSGVDAATVTCIATTTDTPVLTGSVSNITARNDADTPAQLTLTTKVGTLFGRVVSPYGSLSANPVGGVTVTVSGIVGYDGATPITGSAQIPTDTSGCFAIVQGSNTPATGGPTGCSSVSAANTNQQDLKLVSSAVTVSVSSGTITDALADTSRTLSSGLNTLTVRPTPVQFGSSVLLTSSTPTDLSQARVTVTKLQAQGSGTVTVTASSGGALTWTDSAIGTSGFAWRGSYQVTATLAGFTQASAEVDCPTDPATTTGTTCVIKAGGSLGLAQLGSLSGTLTAHLGDQATYTDSTGAVQTYPTQPLVGARVTATPCTTNTGTCTAAGAQFFASSDSRGFFQITGAASPYVMPTGGSWEITVANAGYITTTQRVTINPGDNTLPDGDVFTRPVNFAVGIQIGPGQLFTCPTDTPDCATVTLTRVETGQQFTVTTGTSTTNSANVTTTRYLFNSLNPATYIVTISGDGLTQTSTQYTVPLGTPQPLDVPVPVVQNSVSGIVQGPVGKIGTPTAQNNVSIELGHMDASTPAQFVTDRGTNGALLIATTATNAAGVAGAFTFSNVRNGTYIARYNQGTTTPLIAKVDGFDSAISTSFVSVGAGQSASFPTVVLPRVTRPVELTVTPTASGDDVSGATNVTLKSAADSSWVLSPLPVAAAGGAYTWRFETVPSGNWLISYTLPLRHLGALTPTTTAPVLGCSPNPTVTTVVACTATSANPLTVPGTATSSTVVPAAYSLNEFSVGLTVLAHRLAADPNAAIPTTSLIVTTATNPPTTPPTSTSVYTDSGFTVVTATPSTPTDSFWGRTGATYAASATTGVTNWTVTNRSLTAASPSTPLDITEVGAPVSVKLTSPTGTPGSATVTVTLTPPTGSGVTGPSPNINVDATGGTTTFSDLPFTGTGLWTVDVTGTYTVADVPAHGSTPDVPAHDETLTGQATFTVNSLTPPTVLVTLTVSP
ncbi:MAG: large repetitive protein [Pseudonocardiales bacterium]|nr:large repetitive protein [Pseudonocardiales bacterium]